MISPERLDKLRFMADHNGMEPARIESMKRNNVVPSPEISAMVIITTTELKQFLAAMDRATESAKEFGESMNEEQS